MTELLAVSTQDPAKSQSLTVYPESLFPLAMSQDGQYVLFQSDHTDENDHRATYLFDRARGPLSKGPDISIRWPAVSWSGHGFWTDWLVHVDLNFRTNTYPELRQAVGVTAQDQIVAATFSADGNRLALLVMPDKADLGRPKLNLDLILVDADGTSMVRKPGVVQPWQDLPSGPVARLSMSPDGTRLVIMAESPRAALVEVKNPNRENWKPLGDTEISGPVQRVNWTAPGLSIPLWSRDSQYVWIPLSAPFIGNREGITVSRLSKVVTAFAWTPDGKGLLLAVQDPGGFIVAGADGTTTPALLPANANPIGFLQDGRLLISVRK